MNQYQLIPLGLTAEIMEAFYGPRPSEASLIAAGQAAAEGVEPVNEFIKRQIMRQEDVVHFDETGLGLDGKTPWSHSASTERLIYYTVHNKRGQQAMDEVGILAYLKSCAFHDGWRSYFKYNDNHGLCNVHHLGRLNFLLERYPQEWVKPMIDLFMKIKETVDKAKENKETNLSQEQLTKFKNEYDRVVEEGLEASPLLESEEGIPKKRGRVKQTLSRNLLEIFEMHKDFVLAFMYDFRVHFDNNLAERDIRMMKLKQKISGCFRTYRGAESYCSIK